MSALSENYIESSGDEIAALQERLRDGDEALALELAGEVRGFGTDDQRSWALEVLACARCPLYDALVAGLIVDQLASGTDHMCFAAIAAIGDLPCRMRLVLHPYLRLMIADPDLSMKLRSAVAAAAAEIALPRIESRSLRSKKAKSK